jgi:hypothetical protein
VTLTRSRYPEGIPGVPSSPCWTITSRWLYLDADWNTRPPFGTSLCLRIGGNTEPGHPGITLDVNAPLGEPNRLYLWLSPWTVQVSLPQLRACVPTGEERRGIPVYRDQLTWPHLPDGWRHPVTVTRLRDRS